MIEIEMCLHQDISITYLNVIFSLSLFLSPNLVKNKLQNKVDSGVWLGEGVKS